MSLGGRGEDLKNKCVQRQKFIFVFHCGIRNKVRFYLMSFLNGYHQEIHVFYASLRIVRFYNLICIYSAFTTNILRSHFIV